MLAFPLTKETVRPSVVFAVVCALIVVGLAAIPALGLERGVNLVPEEFVELYFRDGEAYGWSNMMYEGDADKMHFILDEEVTFDGVRSYKIVSDDATPYGKWDFRYQPKLGVLKQGQTFRAEVWYKAEYPEGSPPPELRIRLAAHSEGWQEYAPVWFEPIPLPNSDGWTLMVGSLTLPQKEPWNLLFELMVHKSASTVWFSAPELMLISE